MENHTSVDGIFSKREYSKHKNKKTNKRPIIWFFIISILLVAIGVGLIFFSDMVLLAQVFGSGKHLIIFQNSAELRPTGGFIGSFAEAKTNNFRIEKLDFESNIYKRDNDFTRENMIIPKDEILAEFIPESGLAMRDSNWSVDFSEAAKEINWFYEHEGGESVDTVMAVNSEFFKDLLEIIGDIDMVKYDITVNSTNFNEVVQEQVEENYYESQANEAVSEPKSILSEMMPIAISRIKKIKNLNSICKLILSSLKNKNIQLFSFKPAIEKKIVDKNWGGILDNTKGDYLSINNANLGANKSSIYVNEAIRYNIQDINNHLSSELSIIRSYPKEKPGKENINFTRVYVPNGSILKKAYSNDQDITNEVVTSSEFGKTVFRMWSNVSVGEQKTIKLIYDLPDYINNNNYDLQIQKQSGAVNQHLIVEYNNIQKYNNDFTKDIKLSKK